jgi:NTE family protein
MPAQSIAIALGGGGARGLAHLGVLEVLDEEGILPTFLSGTSMGGLIAALRATGTDPDDITAIARRFRLPGRFVPGRMLRWDTIFASAVPLLQDRSFGDLVTPLVVSAVDLMTGAEVALCSGPLLPAVRATCAVPGVFPPERIGSRCLVDGGVTNILPVDLAWACDPDIVIAVNIVASPPPTLRLDSAYGRIATALGRVIPNPVTAFLAYEIAMRSVEIALDRQRAMAVAMTGPEVLIDVDLSHVSISDFHRFDEIVEAGREATRRALPRIRSAVSAPATSGERATASATLHIDPVCRMTVSLARARAICEHDGSTFYFCSTSCRDTFVLHAERYTYATRDAS